MNTQPALQATAEVIQLPTAHAAPAQKAIAKPIQWLRMLKGLATHPEFLSQHKSGNGSVRHSAIFRDILNALARDAKLSPKRTKFLITAIACYSRYQVDMKDIERTLVGGCIVIGKYQRFRIAEELAALLAATEQRPRNDGATAAQPFRNGSATVSQPEGQEMQANQQVVETQVKKSKLKERSYESEPVMPDKIEIKSFSYWNKDDHFNCFIGPIEFTGQFETSIDRLWKQNDGTDRSWISDLEQSIRQLNGRVSDLTPITRTEGKRKTVKGKPIVGVALVLIDNRISVIERNDVRNQFDLKANTSTNPKAPDLIYKK